MEKKLAYLVVKGTKYLYRLPRAKYAFCSWVKRPDEAKRYEMFEEAIGVAKKVGGNVKLVQFTKSYYCAEYDRDDQKVHVYDHWTTEKAKTKNDAIDEEVAGLKYEIELRQNAIRELESAKEAN